MLNIRKWALRLSVALAVLIPLYFAGSALGAKFGLWDWRFGFGTLVRQYGTMLLKGSALLGLISLLLCFVVKPRQGFIAALFGLLIPVLGLGYGASVQKTAKALPFIHDISTDTINPVSYSSNMIALRGSGSNSLDYLNKTEPRTKLSNAVAQTKAYPDIMPKKLSQSPQVVFDKSLALVQTMGWDLVSQNRQSGVIEATASTLWFGFKDDVAIRIIQNLDQETGVRTDTVLDVRSVSRVGGSDLGANAKRVRKFLANF